MFGKWCVVSGDARRRKGYIEIKVKCEHTADPVWKIYSNLQAGKSSGCPKCNKITYTEDERKLAKRYGAMMSRCFNTRDPSYPNYGGRGIKVSPDLQSVTSYLKYVKALPNFNMSLELDRINNDGDYAPGNLRWINRKEQNLNKRTTLYVVFKNEEILFHDFVREHTYLSLSRVRAYLKEGHSPEEISEMVPAKRGRRLQGLRSGKLRPGESVYGRKFNRA